ncbi:ADP/ATP-dependent (S)-NAD(P)H-hydrate dehydratase [Agrococcus sp. Marseille-Q4369]|uniref:ADP-dependent NAD(P)H-hydrate dehydratase n=1 Tax=Agrococcus sp. Marseille-Q4369 TaxID=2810513 RepID=UPI001B8CB122|nr:ADP/ATP-dependent (S)-NAD(P)H-hydrate dehydratase [Agrococcus sp. Marseille-Q4369]QUW19149.1 NAD(P)H-hydrate dehydratase [Agrococcus sp. Marseille-Q4369]
MEWLRAPGADDDKRSMGVLGVITGSERYPGAAVLGVEAAWRTGIGMVRLWAPRRVQDLVLARRPETVCHALDEPADGVDAWLLGSGQDARERDPRLRSLLLEALRSSVPCVVDAGALDLVPGHAGPAVVTPHGRELERILEQLGVRVDEDERMRAAAAAAALDAVVVAKGAATHVVEPSGATATVEAATHRLATAGTGDVLAGMLGAIVSVNAEAARGAQALASIAALAVALHGAAAAAAAVGGRPITALDVAEHVPAAVAARMAR